MYGVSLSVPLVRVVCLPYLQVSLFSFLGEHSEIKASCSSKEPYCLILLAPGFLAGVAPGGGGVFSIPLHNSFVFKVRLLKFFTELLWDKMNILR